MKFEFYIFYVISKLFEKKRLIEYIIKKSIMFKVYRVIF